MTENRIEYGDLRLDALEGMFASGEVSEIKEGDVEIMKVLIERRLMPGAELSPRQWSKKYSENKSGLVKLFGEDAVGVLEEMSERICPEPGKARDKSTKARGTRMPKFLQDLVRLAAGEDSMSAERFVDRFQTRLRYYREREAGQHKGEVLNPTPISTEAAVAVIRWLDTGEIS
jgi:hypothetical protein